jgi:copper transport protein
VGSRRCSSTSISIEIAAVIAAAFVFAPAAGAHAFLKQSDPASGAALAQPPKVVRLIFDEGVKPAPGIKVLRGGGQSVVAGKPFQPDGKETEIDVPLRGNLGSGPYAVIWKEIDRDDGHLISGAFIFSVGSAPPTPSAQESSGASSGPPLSAVISRWLLLAGLLAAAGSVAFDVLVRRHLPRRTLALTLTASLALAALGAVLNVVLVAGSSGTTFGHRTSLGAAVAAVGALLALASLWRAELLFVAAAIAVLLLGLPPATGHASAPHVTRALSIPADLVHLLAAAFWIGGVLQLILTARDSRVALMRRFTPFAITAVALLGASGVVRAFNELSSVHQIWTTGYGRALIVKTAVFAVLLALGWLRTSVLLELALFVVVVGAVAVLTNVRPGRDYAAVQTQTGPATVVFAGQDNDLAVGLALTPRKGNAVDLRATVLGFEGPVSGLDVSFGVQSRRAVAAACGGGCYRATLAGPPRAVSIRIAGRRHPAKTLSFTGPSEWPAPPGLEIVRHAETVIDELHTLVVHSHLASDSKHAVTTTYKMAAPDRLAYVNTDGSGSVIIGNRRWDRPGAGAKWRASPQVPALRQPAPFWPREITNIRVLRSDRFDGRPVWVVSFLDPATPAWFTAWIDRSTYRTLQLEMVATAHFMRDRDGPFDTPLRVEPPK